MSSEEGSSSKAAVAVAGGTAAAGCLMSPAVLIVIAAAVLVLGGLATLLAPVLLIFHGIDVGAAAGKNPTSSKPVNAGPPPQIDPDKVSASVRGDGTGTLVMDPLQTFFGVGGLILQGIKDAGCTEITPIVIAAQLDVASGLDRNKVGPNGVKGITQVPIDTLKQFGYTEPAKGGIVDSDGTGDEIKAFEKYMCSIVGQVKQFAQPGQNVLDLSLAAFATSVDAVQKANGIPATNAAQKYVLAVRSKFPQYDGTYPLGYKAPDIPTDDPDKPADPNAPANQDTSGTSSPSGTPGETKTMLVTLYGSLDNDPPGSTDIAYPQKHTKAGGTGTYADPITFATDKTEYPPGTMIYYGYLKKYFVMEDFCQQCVDDWKKQKQHIDLYAGDSQDKSILTCENSLTQDNGSVVFNPAADLPVDTSPIFDPKSNQCHKP